MLPLSAWPAAERRGIVGVFTDIDDTLTTEGAITPDALDALARLKQAGLHVVAITGRPVGWCQRFVSPGTAWPVDCIVAENGAVALPGATFSAKDSGQIGSFPLQNGHRQLSNLYQQDAAQRVANAARMQTVAARVLRELPGVTLSRDAAGRETDLAFDYAEFTNLPAAVVQQVVALLQAEGMHTTVSSIHIHGCFGQFDKWRGACWIARELWGVGLAQALPHWVFVGDSGNDQAMFQHFTHSVGVANIARFLPALAYRPRYVTEAERGSGFAEVASALLQSRR
jgi:HAD superfamily hydrolase (TIGR01484 family)